MVNVVAVTYYRVHTTVVRRRVGHSRIVVHRDLIVTVLRTAAPTKRAVCRVIINVTHLARLVVQRVVHISPVMTAVAA